MILLCFVHSGIALGQTTITQQTGRYRICKGNVTDSDKALNKSDYDHNENSTLTLSVPGAKSISLQFSSFCTESLPQGPSKI